MAGTRTPSERKYAREAALIRRKAGVTRRTLSARATISRAYAMGLEMPKARRPEKAAGLSALPPASVPADGVREEGSRDP
jgi:hypothetical protein